MVDRSSQPFELSVERAQPGSVNLGQGRYEAPQSEGLSSAEQLLNGLFKIGGAVAQEGINQSAQKSFLEGQRARMAGESADAVEADPFSRPFVNGGYNTEDYRLAQAEMSRDLKTFIADQGRAMSPQEFSRVVQERAAPVTSRFNSLPMQGKLQAITAQQKLEESLFSEQAGAYQAFVIEQGSKRFLAQGNQITTDLLDGGSAYQSNVERAALFYTDLLTTDKLPAQVRTTMAKDYLLSLANADQRDVITQLRSSGMLNALSFKERTELDSAMRASGVRTEAKDALGTVMEDAQFESRLARGELSAGELRDYINTKTNAGLLSYDQGKSLTTRWVSGLADKDSMLGLIQAVGNGDLGALAGMGETAESALTKVDQQHALAGRTVAERMVYGIQQGSKLGTVPKVYGETIGQAVRHVQLAKTDDQLNGSLVDTLNQSISALTAAEQANPGARGTLLAAMPEDTRMAMSYAMQQQSFGVAPVDALKEYSANREQFQQLNDIQKALRGKDMKKLINEQIDGASSSGFWGRIGNFLTGDSNLSSNPAVRQQWSAAIQEEANNLSSNRDMFGTTPESYVETAATNVKNRTIMVGEPGVFGTGVARRPLIMPRGVSVAQVFAGVDDKEALGRKLSEMAPAPSPGLTGSDFTTGYAWNSTMGYLENVTFDKNGARVDVKRVDATAVGNAVRADQEATLNEAREANFGAPVIVSGRPVSMDGVNAQGIPAKSAYRLRKDLAGFEGLRLQVYKDRNGLAVGLGHNVTGTGLKEGDEITVAQAENWFREDTDAAMGTGVTMAQELGVRDPSGVEALAGAAFQLGAAGLRQHTKTADAIQRRDWDTFQREVRSSDWAQQTGNRAEWFIRRMYPHFITR